MSRKSWGAVVVGVTAIGLGIGLSYAYHPTKGRRRRARVAALAGRGAGALADESRKLAARVRLSTPPESEGESDIYEHLEEFAEPAHVVQFDAGPSRGGFLAWLLTGLGGIGIGLLGGAFAQRLIALGRAGRAAERLAAAAASGHGPSRASAV